MKRWLILDCNYLIWRAHHGTGHLKGPRDTSPTGAIFGFFRCLPELQQRFAATGLVFCFDHGKSKRYNLCEGYKSKRADTPEKVEIRKKVHKQIERMKDRKYLQRVGYKNVFYKDGYEADDIIASVVRSILTKSNDKCYIVSADKDLFQLLDCGLTNGPRVFVHNPQSKVTHDRNTFEAEFGINPTHWRTVKALAGCNSDKIPGIKGVGEGTAIKFLTKGVGGVKGEKLKAAIWDKKWMQKQLKLVGLPFPGCPIFRLKNKGSTLDPAAYNKLMDKLGFQSLKDQYRG